MNFVPAKITNEHTGASITCHFAPESISINKRNTWRPQQPRHGQSLAIPQFNSSGPADLSMMLWLDATEVPDRDVAGDAEKLLKLMRPQVDQDNKSGKASKIPQKRPPIVTFQWGATLSFKCVVTSVLIKYTLFDPAGRPLRAQATCHFQQIQHKDEFPKTNPTSGGRTGERIVRLAPRETLEVVAYRSFGRTDLWRAIAAFNGIDDPLRLQPGAEILLPASVDDLAEYA
jgi:Contractile injection system tube protein